MKKLYLVGNSHIDPVWLWRWQDGYSEVLATFRSALDRMKEFGDYKFVSACAVYYEWVEKTDPEMFEEIKQRVKEGRWDIVGGWYLQPDCNIPCGESFARHALVSQRYFKEKFGITARTGYNVDSFGHNASLPKILRGGGMDRYVFMRPCETEHALGFDNFIWKSDDGSEVTTSRLSHYTFFTDEEIALVHQNADKTAVDGVERMSFFGLGNHGGGPSARLLARLNEVKRENYIFSTVDEYFDTNGNTNLPVVTTELQHHARGCYSVMSEVKEMNRRCEANLLACERICLLASKLTGYKYPAKKLKKCWKNLLFNHFHDILAGCAIKSAYADASYLFGEIMSVTEQEINGAMQAIARKVESARGHEPGNALKEQFLVWEHESIGTPFIVFNHHAYPVKTAIRRRVDCAYMTDEAGNVIPSQKIRGEATNGSHDIYETEFIVDLPAYGYRLFRAIAGEKADKFELVKATEHSLENSKLRVEFNAESGEIARIISKADGKIVANGGFGAVITDESECDTWAHEKNDLGQICGEFSNPEFSVLEMGEVCAVLRVEVKNEDCELIRDYKLYADADEIKVELKADFKGKNKALKLCFPAKEEVLCDIPYGTVKRELCNGEEPFAKWFASNGLAVANVGKYGYDSTEDQIRMTVLRGAIFADHYGVRDGRYSYMEQGERYATYSIFPFTSVSDANKRAEILNSPARVVNASYHHGPLDESFEGIGNLPDNVSVTAIKRSEDNDLAVIRVCESDGLDTETEINFLGNAVKLDVGHNAIVTVNENGEKLNFMEWKI